MSEKRILFFNQLDDSNSQLECLLCSSILRITQAGMEETMKNHLEQVHRIQNLRALETKLDNSIENGTFGVVPCKLKFHNSFMNNALKEITALLAKLPQLYEKISLELYDFESFSNFYKENYDFMQIREYMINTMKFSIENDNIIPFAATWAKKLRINDPVSKAINMFRRVWLFFFYSLFNRCDVVEIQAGFYHQTRTVLLYCLPLDRANALYNLNIPWFAVENKNESPNPTYVPSINKRLVSLIHLFNIDEPAIIDFLHPTWSIPEEN